MNVVLWIIGGFVYIAIAGVTENVMRRWAGEEGRWFANMKPPWYLPVFWPITWMGAFYIALVRVSK